MFLDKLRTAVKSKKISIFTVVGIIISTFSSLNKLFLLYNSFAVYLCFFNILLIITKIECIYGIIDNDNGDLYYARNIVNGILVLCAGISFVIYTVIVLIFRAYHEEYTRFEGLYLATLAFVEIVIAIIFFVKDRQKSHYLKTMRISNLLLAFSALLTAQISILSFTGNDSYLGSIIFGMVIGISSIGCGIYIILSPKYGLIDHDYNKFKLVDPSLNKIIDFGEEQRVHRLSLKRGKLSYTFYYEYMVDVDKKEIEGIIIKESVWFKKLNIYIKILIYFFIFMRIIPFIILHIVLGVRRINLHKKLEALMKENGFELIEYN